MFRIGEFSKLTKVTVKTLRYYQEEGLLEPECICYSAKMVLPDYDAYFRVIPPLGEKVMKQLIR